MMLNQDQLMTFDREGYLLVLGIDNACDFKRRLAIKSDGVSIAFFCAQADDICQRRHVQHFDVLVLQPCVPSSASMIAS